MKPDEVKYWHDTIRMLEKIQKERVKGWEALKKRMGVDFTVSGVKEPVIISRMFPLTREFIATTGFQRPYVNLKAEDDPADDASGEVLADASPILEDFANDALDAMQTVPPLRQAILDAMFCFRGWLKFGLVPKSEDGAMVAPYMASDMMQDDFAYIRHIPAENMLIDPLVEPGNPFSARYMIEKMRVSIPDLLRDPRFKNHWVQIRGLERKGTQVDNGFLEGEDKDRRPDELEQETIDEAHRLANTRWAYEAHDRIGRRRLFFLDGIDGPIEEIDHPLLTDVTMDVPDPLTGEKLLQLKNPAPLSEESARRKKKFLVLGGFQYYSICFDVAPKFHWHSLMEYGNTIQNALIRSVTRRQNLLNFYKRLVKVLKSEADDNPNLLKLLTTAEDGEGVPLNQMDALQELNWGHPPPGQVDFERDIMAYESQLLRTVGSEQGSSKTATGRALDASASELNRDYNQGAIENFYEWLVRSLFQVFSEPRFTPEKFMLRTTSQAGAKRAQQALQWWHLRGAYNLNIATGSMNILYERLNTDRALALIDRLRQSPNADPLKLDQYTIRAMGEPDPDMLLKADANVDAAKAAELENQMFFAELHDPGVTEGEDHETHIKFQSPEALAQHPRFAQVPQKFQAALTLPMYQRQVLQLAQQHIQEHQQAQAQESGAPQAGGGGGNGQLKPGDLLSQVQSNAQQTQDVVSREAEQAMRN